MDRRPGDCNALTIHRQEAAVANPVVVTRITIDYVCDGRKFTMVFKDPSKIASIVLGRTDLERLQDVQHELAGANIPRETAVRTHLFNPLDTGTNLRVKPEHPQLVSPIPALPISISGGTSSSDTISINSSRSLWWHNEECTWIHPEGDT
jgi:hypothetical protein